MPPLIGGRGPDLSGRAGPRPTCVHGRRRRRAPRRSEAVEVRVDELVADEERDDARRGPGTARTAPPSCGPPSAPLRAMTAAPTTTPAIERDEDRGRDRAAEVQAEHAGELHVAHAHARAGRATAARKKKPAAGGAGDQLLDDEVRCRARRWRRARRSPPGRVIRFGMIRWSRSMSAIGTSAVTSSSPSDDADRVVLGGHDERVQHAGRRLDERVARRDRRAAGAAAAAQQQPRDHRDVVVGRDRRVAARAVRARDAPATRRAAAGRRRR